MAEARRPFLIESGRVVTHGEFRAAVAVARARLAALTGSRAFTLEAVHGFEAYVKFLSLLEEGHAVALCPPYLFRDPVYRTTLVAEAQTDFSFCGRDEDPAAPASREARVHPLIADAVRNGAMPFIVRTSGSSGKKHKLVLHDLRRFFAKYERIGPHFERTLAFSPADSIAGVETVFETLFHGRSLVLPEAGASPPGPPATAKLIREAEIDCFQTTPTYLRLMVLSRQLTHLPTLRKIAYGSEPSSKQTLERIRTGLPAVELVHTYGMSEIGILRTRTSPEDASVFALDEEINPGRLRDDLLEVRSMTEMLGYLDRPVPRTEDGWFRTGDLARAEGRYLRVLGRNDETLNVAGHKFLPSELEELILGIGEIADVSVGRERNDLIGEAVVAEIMLGDSESDSDFRVRFKRFCEERIPRHMHPQRLVLSRRSPLGTRLKKTRSHP